MINRYAVNTIIGVIFLKKKTVKNLSAYFVAICSFLIYCFASLLILSGNAEKTDTTLENVPYKKAPDDVTVLLECEELSQYCGLIFDFEDNHLTAVLFDNKSSALLYGIEYKKIIKYQKISEMDLIGWLGGIVFSVKNGYNEEKDFMWEFRSGTRIFGSQALSLAENKNCRSIIAHAILSDLLTRDLKKQDFNYLLSLCQTNISYIDFCEYKDFIAKIGKNITIVTE